MTSDNDSGAGLFSFGVVVRDDAERSAISAAFARSCFFGFSASWYVGSMQGCAPRLPLSVYRPRLGSRRRRAFVQTAVL